ncbi:MAG: CBS domain-containing protein [Thermoproteota archaeon]|jgi:malate dehydrogenase (oxaloacetate-decarboxylating)
MAKVISQGFVKDYMRRNVYYVDFNATVYEASKIMKAHDVGSVIVKLNDQPVGIVTERDILLKVIGEGKDPKKVKVGEIMSSPLVTVKADDTIEEALKKMSIYGFRRLPVVGKNGKIVGMFAQRFLIRPTEEELKLRASLPSEISPKFHEFYSGKIEVIPKVQITSYKDFAIWYTPGVASPCKEILKDLSKVFSYTNKGNTVAVISDGSRTLGLGDIGPYASLPVMEGKALLFKYLGGIDAFPITLNVKDSDKIIEVVKAIEPVFGGINLEDIATPKCFYIYERLYEELDIPVWHDDQHGTALVTLAALINALKIVGKKHTDIYVTLIGAGAANYRIAKILMAYGIKPGNIICVDSKGILNKNRLDVKEENFYKWELCNITNEENREGGIPEAMKGSDVVIAMSRPGPGVIKPEWIKLMNDNAIVFACANPVPEIWPWEAKEAGARIVATGRSDFPNQVNNSLGFPAVFRGALEVLAKKITNEMLIAAAEAIAKVAEEYEINEDYIIPTMEQEEVYIEEALAVALKAQDIGVARLKLSKDELSSRINEKINRVKKMLDILIGEGIIKRYVGIA